MKYLGKHINVYDIWFDDENMIHEKYVVEPNSIYIFPVNIPPAKNVYMQIGILEYRPSFTIRINFRHGILGEKIRWSEYESDLKLGYFRKLVMVGPNRIKGYERYYLYQFVVDPSVETVLLHVHNEESARNTVKIVRLPFLP